MNNVNNKIIIVTGGMGQLGRQFSKSLLKNGAKVAIFDLNVSGEIIKEKFPNVDLNKDILFLETDITKRESIENALQEVKKLWGIPYGLINNAGIDSPPDSLGEENGPYETYPESSWDNVMDVNLKGLHLCCQVIGSLMALNNLGSIINICSIYGIVSPNQNIYKYRNIDGKKFFKPVAYSASKSAIVNLTKYLATYWAEKNVRVNTLTLGGVFNNQDKEFLDEYCKRVPLNRMANEDEYNGAINFLISNASSYMTGSNLIVDGGYTAW